MPTRAWTRTASSEPSRARASVSADPDEDSGQMTANREGDSCATVSAPRACSVIASCASLRYLPVRGRRPPSDVGSSSSSSKQAEGTPVTVGAGPLLGQQSLESDDVHLRTVRVHPGVAFEPAPPAHPHQPHRQRDQAQRQQRRPHGGRNLLDQVEDRSDSAWPGLGGGFPVSPACCGTTSATVTAATGRRRFARARARCRGAVRAGPGRAARSSRAGRGGVGSRGRGLGGVAVPCRRRRGRLGLAFVSGAGQRGGPGVHLGLYSLRPCPDGQAAVLAGVHTERCPLLGVGLHRDAGLADVVGGHPARRRYDLGVCRGADREGDQRDGSGGSTNHLPSHIGPGGGALDLSGPVSTPLCRGVQPILS